MTTPLTHGALAALCVLRPSLASADTRGELTVGAEVDRCTPPDGSPAWAPAAWAAFGIDDAWTVLAAAFRAHHALEARTGEPGSLDVTGLAAGMEYSLDVLEVRPFLDLLGGALAEQRGGEGRGRETRAQVELGAGVDWSFWRYATVGLAGRWNVPLRGGEGYFRVGPRLALRWP